MSNLIVDPALYDTGGGAFDPLSYGSPIHAFWAEDPSWTNPGDGNEVTSWRNDGSNGTAVTSATGPDYVASGINGKPSLDFVAASSEFLSMTAGSATVTQPGTVVYVCEFDLLNNSSGHKVVTGADITDRWLTDARGSTSDWRMFSGSGVTGGSVATGTTYVRVCVYDGASSDSRVNGVASISGNPGTANLDGLVLGARYNTTDHYFDGLLAFVAVYDSDITGESWFSDLEDGLMTHYGVP